MSRSEQWLKILTLKCEEASALASQELDVPLGVAEFLAVRGHMLVCRSCRRLRRQLLFLRDAMRRRDTEIPDPEPADCALSAQARSRIDTRLGAGFAASRWHPMIPWRGTRTR